MPDYQLLPRFRNYIGQEKYIVSGNTITPSDSECFDEQTLDYALRALKRIEEQNKRNLKKRDKRKRFIHSR